MHEDDARRPWEFDGRRGDRRHATDVAAAAVAPATRAATAIARDARPHHERVRCAGRGATPESDGPLTGRSARPSGSRDMPVAIMTGVVLGAVVLIAYDVSTVLMAMLASVVVVIAGGRGLRRVPLGGPPPGDRPRPRRDA